MDTVIDEREKAAAVAADLLQQDFYAEAVDSKNSVLSRDEEILAASLRLDCKPRESREHNGKMLLKQEKSKEGTRTVENPPRKTRSQEKGAAGSSGSVNRPHSDSSTTPLTKQQPKSPGPRKSRLGLTRKLLLASRWQLFIKAILRSNWIRLKLTIFREKC
jgi:hypothetical protein